MSDFSYPILIVTGMHRSGTSLTASLLQSAGVDIGKNLIAPSEGNLRGHFEDLDIVQFHENTLKANHLPPEGWTMINQVDYIPENLRQKVKEVISKKRNQANITGWKDPRGTLFLKFWESELPEAKFIFLYRNPWEVIDSLYRRGDTIFQKNPELALQFWKNYNQAIIRFYNNYSEKSILLNIRYIRDNPDLISKKMAEKFNLKISVQSQVYESSLLKFYNENSPYSLLIQQFFPDCIKIYQQLESRCDSPVKEKYDFHSKTQIQSSLNQKYLLENWLKQRTTERNLLKVQSQLENLEQKEKELKTTLDQTTEALHHSQTQLVEKEAKIRYLEEEIVKMESSKFWKMRQLWMRIKKIL